MRHEFPPRTLQSARMIHMLTGRLHYVLDGRPLILNPGDICLLAAGMRDASHVDEVETDPRQKRTIGDLAAVAGVSESQLRRMFKRELGILPKQYLIRARMEYARRYLQSERLRVKEVANLMGFNTAFEFSAQYRKVHGIAPSRDRPQR